MDFADPLNVLEEVIGKGLHEVDGQEGTLQHGGEEKRPAELFGDIDFNGLGLHGFLEDGEEVYGLNIRDSTAHTTEECEYVYFVMSDDV